MAYDYEAYKADYPETFDIVTEYVEAGIGIDNLTEDAVRKISQKIIQDKITTGSDLDFSADTDFAQELVFLMSSPSQRQAEMVREKAAKNIWKAYEGDIKAMFRLALEKDRQEQLERERIRATYRPTFKTIHAALS